LTKKHKLSIRL